MRGKTALVLSAGGMFGAYQAGAWKAIARQFEPDMVVGASVGALNGWAIAGGASGSELADQWLDPATASLMQFHARPGLRNRYFVPDPLLRKARVMLSTYRPMKPFGLVVVELPRMRARLVRGPDVLPEHLLATCSIPFFFPSVRVHGRRFTDGGFLEPVPLWAAAEMGATRIVAINSLPRGVGPWWLQAGVRTVRLLVPQRRLSREIIVTSITPSERLGSAHDAVIWKETNVRKWIDLGERDAERQGYNEAFYADVSDLPDEGESAAAVSLGAACDRLGEREAEGLRAAGRGLRGE